MTLLFPQNVYKNCFLKIFKKTWYVNGGETEGLCESTKWVVRRCSVKKMFWKISQNSQENTCARVSLFLIKLQASFSINYIEKEALVQVFSSDFCKTFKNIFFYRTPPVAASKKILNVLESTEFKEKNEIKFKADVLRKRFC